MCEPKTYRPAFINTETVLFHQLTPVYYLRFSPGGWNMSQYRSLLVHSLVSFFFFILFCVCVWGGGQNKTNQEGSRESGINLSVRPGIPPNG